MRLLVVAPGAKYSIHDVAVGYVRALINQGHEVGSYNLTDRIALASHWVDYMRRRARRNDPTCTMDKQQRLDRVFMEACHDLLPMALDNPIDGVLIISAMFVPGQVLFRLKRAGIPVGIVLTESPYDDDRHEQLAPLADVVWTNERTSIERLRRVQPNTYYLPAAYDPATHRPGPQPGDEDVPSHDVVFVGTAFRERIDLLAAVDWTGIDLALYGNWDCSVGGHRPNSKARRLLAPYIKGGLVNNQTAAALYRRAKIGLNLHRTSIDFQGTRHVERAESLNPRAYELAACGVFQVCDHRAEVDEVFGPHITTIGNGRHLGEVVRRYLDRPDWCASIATRAGECVAPHTFDARARQLVEQFETVISGRYAVAYGD